jgi:anti-sigma factor RsiW
MKRNEKKLLHKALDGEASAAETKRLEKHLSEDQVMKAEFKELRQVVKDTTHIRVPVPKDFTSKVLEETRRRQKPSKK